MSESEESIYLFCMTNFRFGLVDRYLLRPVVRRHNAEHEFTQSQR